MNAASLITKFGLFSPFFRSVELNIESGKNWSQIFPGFLSGPLDSTYFDLPANSDCTHAGAAHPPEVTLLHQCLNPTRSRERERRRSRCRT